MGNEFVILVIVNILNGLNPRRKKHATADDAGIMGDIGSTTVTGYTAFGAVNDGILFGVDGGLFVTLPNDGIMLASR
jgi:hypothetical protein